MGSKELHATRCRPSLLGDWPKRFHGHVEEKLKKVGEVALEITVSVGVGTAPPLALDAGTLRDAPNRALYRAKGSGRNQVAVACQ